MVHLIPVDRPSESSNIFADFFAKRDGEKLRFYSRVASLAFFIGLAGLATVIAGLIQQYAFTLDWRQPIWRSGATFTSIGIYGVGISNVLMLSLPAVEFDIDVQLKSAPIFRRIVNTTLGSFLVAYGILALTAYPYILGVPLFLTGLFFLLDSTLTEPMRLILMRNSNCGAL